MPIFVATPLKEGRAYLVEQVFSLFLLTCTSLNSIFGILVYEILVENDPPEEKSMFTNYYQTTQFRQGLV